MKYNLQGEEVLQNMAFNPTLSQEQAARTFAEYMGDDYPYSVFLLKGYAGTGKTTLLDAITRTMEDIGYGTNGYDDTPQNLSSYCSICRGRRCL